MDIDTKKYDKKSEKNSLLFLHPINLILVFVLSDGMPTIQD